MQETNLRTLDFGSNTLTTRKNYNEIPGTPSRAIEATKCYQLSQHIPPSLPFSVGVGAPLRQGSGSLLGSHSLQQTKVKTHFQHSNIRYRQMNK